MKRWIGMLLAVLMLTGCGAQQTAEPSAAEESAEPNSRTVFAMDTVMDLSAYGADDALMEAAEQEILDLESRLSVTDENSEIYALDRDGQAELSPDTAELMETALEMCGRTQGALDISIYPVLRAWGFTTGSYQVPAQEELQNLLAVDLFRHGAAEILLKILIDGHTAGSGGGLQGVHRVLILGLHTVRELVALCLSGLQTLLDGGHLLDGVTHHVIKP